MRLGCVIHQSEALAGKGVDAGGVGAAQDPAAVTAEFAVTEVVDVKETMFG